MSGVMIGASVRAELVLGPNVTQKEVRFPRNSTWLDLNTMQTMTFGGGSDTNLTYQTIKVNASISDPVNMF